MDGQLPRALRLQDRLVLGEDGDLKVAQGFVGGGDVAGVLGEPEAATVVTRYSAVRPDEISVDIVGGKAPIDRLVLAGVLRGDSQQWLERDADWQKVDQNEGRVVIEVFEFDDYAEAVAK